MSNKKLGIIIRNSPYDNLKVVEAMRLGVGLTLRDIQVYLFFLEDGLIALKEVSMDRDNEPVFVKHLKTLVELGQTLVAEHESIGANENLSKTLDPGLWKRDAIFMFLTQCDGAVVV